MGFFSRIFGGSKQQIELKQWIENGAVVLDVRTPGEFRGGNARGSKNIPLSDLPSRVDEIKKWNKPVVLCCRSGTRAGQAQQVLAKAGIDTINAGSWNKVAGALQ